MPSPKDYDYSPLSGSFKNDLLSLQGANEYVDAIGPQICKFFSNPEFEKEIVKYCINLTDSLMILKVFIY